MAADVSAQLASAMNGTPAIPIDRMQEFKFVFRSMFYVITPNETSFETLEEVPNYLLKSVPYAPLILFAEIFLLWIQGKRLPRWNDALTSMGCTMLLFLPVIVLGQMEMNIYSWFYDNYRLVNLPWNAWYTWALCIFGVDLGFYLWHRAAHEVNFIWAFHQVHHTPEDFNIFTGLRLPSLNRYMAILFYLPCAFFFPPSVFYTHYQINYMFQFWIHTDAIPSLGFLDYVVNNPSLHRVHHGRNRYCIDKNYGAVFSFWDLFFGTFERERKDTPIYYGLVHPINSWDTLYLQVHHLKYMFTRTFELKSLKDKIFLYIKGPGWVPGTPRLGIYEDIPEEPEDKNLYDKKLPLVGNLYLACHLGIAFYLFQRIKITKLIYALTFPNAIYIQALFVLWSIANIGYLLEHKSYVPFLEAARCAAYFALEFLLHETFIASPTSLMIMRVTFGLSFLFWTVNQNMFRAKTKQQ